MCNKPMTEQKMNKKRIDENERWGAEYDYSSNNVNVDADYIESINHRKLYDECMESAPSPMEESRGESRHIREHAAQVLAMVNRAEEAIVVRNNHERTKKIVVFTGIGLLVLFAIRFLAVVENLQEYGGTELYFSGEKSASVKSQIKDLDSLFSSPLGRSNRPISAPHNQPDKSSKSAPKAIRGFKAKDASVSKSRAKGARTGSKIKAPRAI